MHSLTNLTEANNLKLSDTTYNLLSSLNAALGGGDGTEGPFAELMAQIKALSPHNSTSQNQSPSQNSSSQNAPTNGQQTQSNVQTNATGQTDLSGVHTHTHALLASLGLTNKFHKHGGKDHASQDDSNNNNNNVNAQSVVNAQTSTTTNPNQNNNASPPVSVSTAANSVVSASADAPANNTNTDPTLAAALVTDPTAVLAADPTQTDPSLPTAALGATANAAANATASSNNSPPVSQDTAPQSEADIITAELMRILTELEQLAAQQLTSANLQAQANATATAATPTQDPNATSQTDVAANANAPSPDLRSLLAALANLNNPPPANANDQTANNNDQTDAANVNLSTSDATAADQAATTQLENALSKTATTTPTNPAKNNWATSDFFSLFNATPTNPNTTAPLVPTVAADLMANVTTGGNNAGLDLGDGQRAAGSHNGAINLSTDTNLTMPAATSSASPYDFASELSALRATKGGATGLPTPIDQVVLQLSRGLSKDGSSQMTIQLRPAELGRIDVKLNVDSDGKVQGTVTAENPATLDLLLKDVRSLERALQEAGLRADSGSLQFNLRGDSQSGAFGQASGDTSGNNGDAGTQTTSAIAVPGGADAVETYYLTPGGVNMRV